MKTQTIEALANAGISYSDALALRRISMTLHRWHELECGTDSGSVERDEKTGKPFFRSAYNDSKHVIPDRETGALKRLAAIMEGYLELTAYVQGDPRGAALYIVRPGDVPEGSEVDSCYSNGIAVYK